MASPRLAVYSSVPFGARGLASRVSGLVLTLAACSCADCAATAGFTCGVCACARKLRLKWGATIQAETANRTQRIPMTVRDEKWRKLPPYLPFPDGSFGF